MRTWLIRSAISCSLTRTTPTLHGGAKNWHARQTKGDWRHAWRAVITCARWEPRYAHMWRRWIERGSSTLRPSWFFSHSPGLAAWKGIECECVTFQPKTIFWATASLVALGGRNEQNPWNSFPEREGALASSLTCGWRSGSDRQRSTFGFKQGWLCQSRRRQGLHS